MDSDTTYIIKKIRKTCPIDIEKTYDSVIIDLKKELEEVKIAIENKDKENLQEELGDVLMNLLFLIDIANEEYNIKTEDIIEEMKHKLIFRHPHVFETPNFKVSKEVAQQIWEDRKQQQKNKTLR